MRKIRRNRYLVADSFISYDSIKSNNNHPTAVRITGYAYPILWQQTFTYIKLGFAALC